MKTFLGNFKLALFLAFKSMYKGNRWALALIIVVMAFSFVNLIFTSSLISGVMTTMDGQLVKTLFANLVIRPLENKFYLERAEELEQRVSQIDGIAEVATHLNDRGFIEYGWKEKSWPWDRVKSGTWNVIGVIPMQEVGVTDIGRSIIDGRYLDEDDTDSIVLGIEIAGGNRAQTSNFLTLGGAMVGEKVRVTYSNGTEREYTIKGIFRAREMLQADHLAFVTRKEMLSVLGRPLFFNRASELLVKTNEGASPDRVIAEIKAMGLDLEVRGWDEFGGAYRSVISTFILISDVIGGTGLGVATIVMFIIIYINVLSRKRQIGILRAIGIPQNVVVGSYLIQALFYAICGIILGWFIIRLVVQPYFMANPIDFPMGLLSLNIESGKIVAAAFGLTVAALLAGLIPSWTVMKESIIKTLWGV
jgi:putative ABC transport system permease protein